MACWKRGNEDMAEWHEEISDEIFEYVDFHGDEASEASKEQHEIIDSSDLWMYS